MKKYLFLGFLFLFFPLVIASAETTLIDDEYNFFTDFTHSLQSLGLFTVAGESRQCSTYDNYNTVVDGYIAKSTLLNNAGCSAGVALFDVFDTDWHFLAEYRSEDIGNGITTPAPRIIEVYCCPYEACNSDADCSNPPASDYGNVCNTQYGSCYGEDSPPATNDQLSCIPGEDWCCYDNGWVADYSAHRCCPPDYPFYIGRGIYNDRCSMYDTLDADNYYTNLATCDYLYSYDTSQFTIEKTCSDYNYKVCKRNRISQWINGWDNRGIILNVCGVTCTSDLQCPTDEVSDNFCYLNQIMKTTVHHSCSNYNCISSESTEVVETCSFSCEMVEPEEQLYHTFAVFTTTAIATCVGCIENEIILLDEVYYICRNGNLEAVLDLVEFSEEEQRLLLEQINLLQLTIEEKAQLINALTLNIEEQSIIVASLQLSLDEKILLVSALTTNINDQSILISNLELNLAEKIEIVNQLTTNINEQAILIQGLTTNINEQAQIINRLDITIQEQSAIIDSMQLTLSEQSSLISALQLSISDQAILINNLNLNIDEQATLISQLELTTIEQQQLISLLQLSISDQAQNIIDLNLNIQQQADYINDLNINLQEKAILISQLTVTTQEQADLISAMELSFSDQADIINALQNTITDDAEIISNLNLNIQNQAKLINEMQLTVSEQADLIVALNLNIAEQQQLISELEVTLIDKVLIILGLQENLEDQILIITGLELTIEQQAQHIIELNLNLQEQADYIVLLDLSNIESAQLINELNLNLADQVNLINNLNLIISDDAEIIKNLELSLSEEAELIGLYTDELDKQAILIAELGLSLEEEQYIVNALRDIIEEQLALLALIEAENKFTLENVWEDYKIAILIIGGFLFLLIVMGGKRKR